MHTVSDDEGLGTKLKCIKAILIHSLLNCVEQNATHATHVHKMLYWLVALLYMDSQLITVIPS